MSFQQHPRESIPWPEGPWEQSGPGYCSMRSHCRLHSYWPGVVAAGLCSPVAMAQGWAAAGLPGLLFLLFCCGQPLLVPSHTATQQVTISQGITNQATIRSQTTLQATTIQTTTSQTTTSQTTQSPSGTLREGQGCKGVGRHGVAFRSSGKTTSWREEGEACLFPSTLSCRPDNR